MDSTCGENCLSMKLPITHEMIKSALDRLTLASYNEANEH